MMKRIIFLFFLVLFSFVKGNCQINNLKDLLGISELTVEETVGELQYTWELKSPIQDTSEKGFITERYIFVYNRENKKQILKKCGRVNLTTRETIWLTNFISNDKDLLNRITKNLTYQGFELKGKLKSNSMYEDGNRTVTIQTESENDSKLPLGCYSINVVVDKKLNASYTLNKADKEVIKVEKKKSNPETAKNATSQSSARNYPKYLFELKNYSPEISFVCQDQGYSDCFRDATEFVKELVEIRISHEKNKFNESYLKFYETKSAVLDKRSWEVDAQSINKYIVENIEIYEATIKECGYDNLDWFKKMPKDLYKHFNLNKAELISKSK